MFTGFPPRSTLRSSTPSRVATPGARHRLVAALLLALTASFALATSADARIGGGGSFGSRGSRTFSMPSATPTAPRTSPFARSATQNAGVGTSGFARPASGFFGGGLGRGLIGGFLGAGLFGMLFGGGFFGGLGGGMSLIGLILQAGLIYLAVRFVMGFLAGRGRQPTYAGAPASSGARPPETFSRAASGPSPATTRSAPVDIGPEDYQAFEHRLTESQTAYSNGDLGFLRRIATPEMAGSFEHELAENDRRGVVNKLSDVRLLQGDLSEAWRESGTDYATVAMRFSLIDAVVEKESGRVVAGHPTSPQEVTEVWTFRRPTGGSAGAWALSGIQQA